MTGILVDKDLDRIREKRLWPNGRYYSDLSVEELWKRMKCLSRACVARPKFEFGFSRIGSRSANSPTALFSHTTSV